MNKQMLPVLASLTLLVACEDSRSYNSCLLSNLRDASVQAAADEIKGACAREHAEKVPTTHLADFKVKLRAAFFPREDVIYVEIANKSQHWLVHRIQLLVSVGDGASGHGKHYEWAAPSSYQLLAPGDNAELLLGPEFPADKIESTSVTIVEAVGTWTGAGSP